MGKRSRRSSVTAWVACFLVAYLALAVLVSVIGDSIPSWPLLLLWPLGQWFDAAPYTMAGQPTSPRAPRRERILALRWTLCGLFLANAVLLVWRAFSPGELSLTLAGHAFRPLPLDIRFLAQGFDPWTLLLGLFLGFIALSELRLLASPYRPTTQAN